MQDTTLNLNSAECIKEASRIGSTVYTNICNGHTTTVAWGGADWAVVGFATTGGLVMLALVSAFVVVVIRDIFNF